MAAPAPVVHAGNRSRAQRIAVRLELEPGASEGSSFGIRMQACRRSQRSVKRAGELLRAAPSRPRAARSRSSAPRAISRFVGALRRLTMGVALVDVNGTRRLVSSGSEGDYKQPSIELLVPSVLFEGPAGMAPSTMADVTPIQPARGRLNSPLCERGLPSP